MRHLKKKWTRQSMPGPGGITCSILPHSVSTDSSEITNIRDVKKSAGNRGRVRFNLATAFEVAPE
jgi:hypothetical protein